MPEKVDDSSKGTPDDAKSLQERYPWATVYALDYPIRYDALDAVMTSLRQLDTHCVESAVVPSGGAVEFIGESEASCEIRSIADRVAATNATVLISGESGTGKEVIARRVHAKSARCNGPFIAINCSAIPDNLLESELFGHEKGAFTSAIAARQGKFEAAAGGTIFLDEIGDMPFGMQVKLLRVLQERTIERIGGIQPIAVDVRVIAASHRDLPAMVESGEFREDLFYRLNVFPIDIPPLRERPEDIESLMVEMIHRVRDVHGVTVRIPPESVRLLEAYRWPGNVRELANVVERLAVQRPFGSVDPDDVTRTLSDAREPSTQGGASVEMPNNAEAPDGDATLDVRAHLGAVEQQLIESALRKADGVVARAAELLGVGRTTLIEKMKRYGLT